MLCLKFICILLFLQSLDANEVRKGDHHKHTTTPKNEVRKGDHKTTTPPKNEVRKGDHKTTTPPKKEATDYCKFKCGKSHIACHNNGKPGPHCPANVKVVPLKSVENVILSLHNEKRNEVAGGNHHKLPTASRMALMQWCDELARLAELKALRCSTSSDKCFSTSSFENPGQINSLLQYVNETDKLTLKALVENRATLWLNASDFCKPEHIKSHNKHNANPICYFSLAVTDKNTHVGCGAVHFEHKPKEYFHMVCNYAHKNEHGKPVYKTGPTASECKTGKDKHFKNLCSPKEKYD